MRHLAYPCAAIAAVFVATPAIAAPVELEVGATHILSATGMIRQVIVDVPGVVDTELRNSRQIEVRGVKPGRATITLVSDRGRTQFSVEVIEAGTIEAAELSRRLSEESGGEKLQVVRRNGNFILSGAVPDLAAHNRILSRATALAGDKVTDLMQITGNQMVAVDVRFIAVSDTTLKSLGFNFSKLSGGFQSALVGPNTLNGFEFNGGGLKIDASPPLQNAFNLFLASRGGGLLGVLSALSDTGLSQVLAQPTLLARSGEQAEFLAGGDIPIPVPQGGGAGGGVITIEYRQYGVRLSVEPYVLSNRRIALKLAPEVSELDYSNGVAIQGFKVPGFRRRSANTTVELGDGESFVIAGLSYASSNTSASKVPLFGDVPILGSLFRRTESSREKLELIIVATPRLVSPLTEAEVAKMMPAPPPAPNLMDSVLHPGAVEKRAASFGLSR
jgi:pilus assembly protein CpaC